MENQNSLNIAVVDDSRLDSEKLQRGINKWLCENHNSNFQIESFKDGEEILKIFEPDKFQIIFMDIIMNMINGIETAKKLRELDSKVLIIFATTSKEFAFEAFPLHPFDYILKPFAPERLDYVLSEAIRILETPEPFINVKISRSSYKIFLKNISAVLANNHSVEIIKNDGETLTCCMTFKELEEVLLEYPRFLECNRGVIINMDHVMSLSKEKESFIMKDGARYAVHVRRRKNILDSFTQYQISRIRSAENEL